MPAADTKSSTMHLSAPGLTESDKQKEKAERMQTGLSVSVSAISPAACQEEPLLILNPEVSALPAPKACAAIPRTPKFPIKEASAIVVPVPAPVPMVPVPLVPAPDSLVLPWRSLIVGPPFLPLGLKWDP